MEVKDYEFGSNGSEHILSEKRKKELIGKLKEIISKDSLPYFKVLEIGENDEEYDFMYKWLIKENISITGINESISEKQDISENVQNYLPDTLEHEEQDRLFRRMQELREKHGIVKGNNYEKVRNELGEDLKEYDKIRHQLIEGNMQFAKFISLKKVKGLDISKEDKQQMGMIGLINAVDGFDPTFGYKFSMYARVAIYHTILKEYASSKGMKINLLPEVKRMEQAEELVYTRLGRKATDTELMQLLGINEKALIKLKKHYEFFKKTLSIDEINEELRAKRNIIEALDDGERIHEAGNDVYYEEGVYVDIPNAEPASDMGLPGRENIEAVRSKAINETLETLTPRETKVLKLRYGLEDGKKRTLEDVRKRNRIVS